MWVLERILEYLGDMVTSLLVWVAVVFIELTVVFAIPPLKEIVLNYPFVSLLSFIVVGSLTAMVHFSASLVYGGFFSEIFFWIVGYIRYLAGWILRMREDGFLQGLLKMMRRPYSLEQERLELYEEFDFMRVIDKDDTDIMLALHPGPFWERIKDVFGLFFKKKDKKPSG